ncbi:MAG: hypothetical protein EOO01_21550 [Chitinophagaceae bacterium]|nr:MAG: hypothetical protein EOO01_21550 [Chitinophagaceae bacterium]
MKVTAILKGRVDSNKEIPIQIRVNIGDKRAFHPTGIKVTKGQFKKGRVVDHPKASQYNEEIKRLIVIYQAQNIEGFQKKTKKIDFYLFLQQCIDQWEKTKRPGTVRIYRSLMNLLKEYRPTLSLHEIDLRFLNEWKAHRLSQVEENTAWSNFSKLRAVINEAVKLELITKYPFKDFVMPVYSQGVPEYLEKEEVKAIEEKLPELNGLAHYGYWFLIACHTAYRVSDIIAFKPKEHIKKARIVVHTAKEGTIVSIPFTDKLRGYFEAIQYKPLGVAEETYREKIKTIAAAAGIKKDISTHTARHTAAVNMASAGLSLEVVAKILGHDDLRSTRVYFKIVNKKLDEDFNSFMNYMG